MVFGNAKTSYRRVFLRDGRLQNVSSCVIVVWQRGIMENHVQEAGYAANMGVESCTTCCYTNTLTSRKLNQGRRQ